MTLKLRFFQPGEIEIKPPIYLRAREGLRKIFGCNPVNLLFSSRSGNLGERLSIETLRRLFPYEREYRGSQVHVPRRRVHTRARRKTGSLGNQEIT